MTRPGATPTQPKTGTLRRDGKWYWKNPKTLVEHGPFNKREEARECSHVLKAESSQPKGESHPD